MNIGALVQNAVNPNNNDPAKQRIAGSLSGTLKAARHAVASRLGKRRL